jgi:site-specific recombinase XerD
MAARTLGEGRKTMNLSEALKVFLIQKQVDGKSERTTEFYQGRIGMFIAFATDKLLKDLTLQDGQAFVLHLASRPRYDGHPFKKPQTEPMSKATLRGYVRAIKVWVTYLFEEGYIKTNVFAKLKLPKDQVRAIQVLSDEELRRIYDAIDPDTMNGARLYAIVTLMVDTGLRLGELVGMKLDDIDFKQSRILVTGKGDKQRFLPFGSTTSKALRRWINMYRPESEEPGVFMVSDRAVTEAIKRLGQRAGIPRLHCHLFRHTFGTNWVKQRGDLIALQTIMGHSDIAVTRMYVTLAQVDVDVQHRAISPLDRLGVGKKLKRTGT